MADRYWRGGSGTWNSSNTANWSATSGGAGGASAPTSADNVIFDLNSGGTYTVTCGGGSCANWTVNAGTVTFNAPSTGTVYANCYGNISITAATLFTAPTNGYGILSHQPSTGAISVAFGSSTTNTQKIYFSASGSGFTSYTWCNAATQTFHAVDINISTVSFTCAGSTITVDNQDRVTSGLDDYFNLASVGGMSVAATTIRMGTTTANGGDTRAYVVIQSNPPTNVEPTLTNFNITYIRTYNRTEWNTKWFFSGTGNPFRFGALTFLSNNTNTHNIIGVYGTNSTFTATNILLNFRPQWTGAVTFTGAFSLPGSYFTYDTESGFTTPSSLTFASTTSLSVSNSIASDLDLNQINAPITFTGAVTLNGSSTDSAVLNIQNSSFNTIFSSTITSTRGYFYVFSNNITFTGTPSFTDPSYINTYAYTTMTISDGLSITGSSTRPDALDSSFNFGGSTLSTASTVTNFSFLNARIAFGFANAMTISNPVVLTGNGGLYFRDANLTLSNNLTANSTGSYSIFACIDSTPRTLTLNGAVNLTNCQLAAPTITVAGGATRNFDYVLNNPIVNNITNLTNTTVVWGDPKAASLPEFCVDTFTITSSGGTFQIAGAATNWQRAFVRPYTLSGTPACTMTTAVAPTLLNVDFWRVTAAGAGTRPWTGTRVGNVGTITDITPTTPKTVYYSGAVSTAWTANNWAATSGGAVNANNYPLPQDTAVFDSNSPSGDVGYSFSVRVGNIDIQNVPSGSIRLYGAAVAVINNNAPIYLWVSGNINGPSSTPAGTFTFGNTSTDTYNSFTTGFIAQCLIIADGSSGATHTIRPTNVTFMRYGSIQFATRGTTDIQSSLPEPLFYVSNFTGDTYTINITADQIGSSSFSYGTNPPAIFALGTPYGLTGAGTVNYGSCNIYTYRFYPSSLTSNTAYTANAGEIDATNSTTLGNINFNQGTTGFAVYQLTVNQAVTILNLSILSLSNFTGTTLRVTHNGSAPRNISMYSLTATYSGSLTTMAISQQFGFKPTFVKLGGGNVSVSGVNVTNIDASPSSTWYTTGTITTSTGWNSGSIPQGRGTFLLFN